MPPQTARSTPFLLSIETATDVCSVAVLVADAVRVELTLDRPRRHAEQLVPMIDEACRLAEVAVRDLSAVGLSCGPGSYTGLRIGASTAKGLAFATGASLVAVPSLQALAAGIPATDGFVVVSSFAARRDEVYAASYRADGAVLPRPLTDAQAGDPASLLDLLIPEGVRNVILVGDGAPRMAAAARGLGIFGRQAPWIRPSAGGVARAAAWLASRGETVDAETFEPYYLREFTARPASRSVFERLPFQAPHSLSS